MIHPLELVFLESLRDFPNLLFQLETDFDYSVENSVVERLVELLEEAKLDVKVLDDIDKPGLFQSQSSHPYENAQDYVLQAILASEATNPDFLIELIKRNPAWLESGWWCFARLMQNPNCPPILVQMMASAAVRMDDSDLAEQLLEHPSISQETSRLILDYLGT